MSSFSGAQYIMSGYRDARYMMSCFDASRAEDPEFDSRLRRGDFSSSSDTSDLKIGTPLATLPVTWPGVIGSALDWLVRCQYTVTGWFCCCCCYRYYTQHPECIRESV